MKKVALVAGFFALALPAFAFWHGHDSSTLSITSTGGVENNVWTVSNTGLNSVTGMTMGRHHDSKGGSITTGDATSVAEVDTSLNDTTVGTTGFKHVTLTNSGEVANNVFTVSNTGLNHVGNTGHITSGDAGSQALVQTMVNTTVVGAE